MSLHHQGLLAALLDLLVPADIAPSATQVGVLEQLEELSAGPLRNTWIELVEPGLDTLAGWRRNSSGPAEHLPSTIADRVGDVLPSKRS